MPVSDSLADRFAKAVDDLGAMPGPIILAVSGGSDSTALMHLAADAVSIERLIAVSVDHGLRSEAHAEIAQVAAQAEGLGMRHQVARWSWNGQGNLQAAARAGRWGALSQVAKNQGATAVWLGHTEDDQVETAVMRLARGSGVDGLAAMARRTMRDGVVIAHRASCHCR